jgi:hypothetical protein
MTLRQAESHPEATATVAETLPLIPSGASCQVQSRVSLFDFGLFLERNLLMCDLRDKEYALLTLAALKPFAYLPYKHRRIAELLLRQGLLRQRNGRWHPTAVGLKHLGYTIH